MNIGIILNSLGLNQLAYESINTVNSEINQGSPYDYRFFFENFSSYCVNPLCAVMNVAEIWHYDGLLISTNLVNTKQSLKAVGDIKRVFIVWDLEWLRGYNNYIDNLAVYRNKNIVLVARSEEHSKAIENYCNRKPNFIMKDLVFRKLADNVR